jgi:restriction system protein
MTIVEAIKAVMLEAGRPMSAREAYAAIIDKSLYDFQAKDPQSIVLMQIRRHCVGIDFPSASPTKHFQFHGDNQFLPLEAVATVAQLPKARPRSTPLRPSGAHRAAHNVLAEVERDLSSLHERYLSLFKQRMLQELKKLTAVGFEAFARELLDAYGFQDTMVTSISRDGGIDGYGKLKVGLAHLNVAFQCKRWTGTNIQRPEIDRFRGAAQGAYEQGIFFTTTSFSKGAIDASIKQGAIPIVLIDGAAIVDLMIARKLRVESTLMEIPLFAL